MNPDNEANFAHAVHDSNLIIVDRDLVTDPLTVIRGYIQLLNRRIRAGRDINDEELLRILDLIESAACRLVAALNEGSTAPSPPKGDKHSHE